LITRELYLDKLKVGWGIRARRYELKVKEGKAGEIAKWCWKEKEEEGVRNMGKRGKGIIIGMDGGKRLKR